MTRSRRPRPMLRAVFILLALTFFSTPAFAQVLKVGDRIAELDGAVDANGKSFKVKAVKGWRMLTFGAQWCKPCAKELPAWDKIAPQWKGKVTFIAVSLDSDTQVGKDFHKKLKLKNMTLVYMSPDSPSAGKYGSDH